jgi:hypothetical protein
MAGAARLRAPFGLRRSFHVFHLTAVGAASLRTSEGHRRDTRDDLALGTPAEELLCRIHVAIGQVATTRAIFEISRFHVGDTVSPDASLRRMEIELIHPRSVIAQDARFHRAIGRAQGREPVFLLHILRNFQRAECLNLPLRRAVPDRISAPEDVISP